MLNSGEDAQRNPARGRQDAPHFTQCRRSVRKELQPLMTEHGVERLVVAQRQLRGVALSSVDLWLDPAGNREHRRAAIDADDASLETDNGKREPSNDARTARDIENARSRMVGWVHSLARTGR